MPYPNIATLTFANFTHILTSKLLLSSPPPLFTLNLTIVTHCTTVNAQLSLNFNIFRTLLHVLLRKFPNSHMRLLLSRYWLKINERLEQKRISITYEVLATYQPHCDLTFVQTPRSNGPSSVFTLLRPSVSSSLKMTNDHFRYSSPHLWIDFLTHCVNPFKLAHVSLTEIIISVTSASLLPSPIIPSVFHSRLKIYLFHKS